MSEVSKICQKIRNMHFFFMHYQLCNDGFDHNFKKSYINFWTECVNYCHSVNKKKWMKKKSNSLTRNLNAKNVP